MFWNKEAMRANRGMKRLCEICSIVLDRYRGSHTMQEMEADTSVVSRLVLRPYKSEQERVADVLTFFIAGHDTTSYQLSWSIIELAKHPEVVAKLRLELDRVLPKGGDPRQITPQHLSQLSYLNDVIKESQRLWPSAPIISSRVALRDIPCGKYTIPKGRIISVQQMAMSRLGIREPDEFIPERWADTDPDAAKLKELFLPFSFGRRGCVGQNLAALEMKLVLAALFYRYEFELLCPEQVKDFFFITLKPLNARFKIKKRVV